MTEKPSVTSSTLTMLAVWSVVMFTLAASSVGWYLAHGGDKEMAALIMTPFSVLLNGFGMAYLAVRKPSNGNPTPTP